MQDFALLHSTFITIAVMELNTHPCLPNCCNSRHKTTIPVLREMVPDDLVNYCQEHGLLDAVLGGDEKALPPGLSGTGRNKAQYFKSLE